MSQYFMKYKDILKILLTIIALWLVSGGMYEAFSVEPGDYNDEVEYGIQNDEIEALGEVENELDVDEVGDDKEDTANVEEDDSGATGDADEIDDGGAEDNPPLEYRDGVYYWTGDMDDDSTDLGGVGIMPLWTGNQTQAQMLSITGNVSTNGFNRTGNITVANGGTLTLNTGTGGTTAVSGRIIVNTGGTLVINAGTVTVTGGTIQNPQPVTSFNHAHAAAVIVNTGGTFTMRGGTVSYSSAVRNAYGAFGWGHSGTIDIAGGTFTMYAGTITGAGTRGIRIHGGTINLRGGNITGNTIPAASATHAASASLGGGILISASNTTINMTGGSISNNSAGHGSGILYMGGSLRTGAASDAGNWNQRLVNVNINLSGGTISHNTATARGGGGIDLISDRLTNNNLINNEANRLNAGSVINLNLSEDIEISHNSAVESGGGIRWNSMGTFTMTGGHIHNNQSSFAPTAPTVGSARFAGGGIAILFSGGQNNARPVGDVTITGGIIENNSSHGHGGGIGNTTMAHLTIGGDTIIRGNTAGWGGGGIRNSYGGATRVDNLTIRDNVLITNNTAHHSGGGISRAGGGSLTINDNVRVINNRAFYDGGGIQWLSTNTFNLNSGTISGNLAESRVVRYGTQADEHFGGGGGITVANGTVNIRGGTIGETIAPPSGVTDNPPAEGAIPLNTMTPNSNRGLSGGGVRVIGGTVTMTGGYIQRNVTTTTPGGNTAAAAGRGGGVFVNGGRFIYNAPGENIRNNLASRGGGAYVRGPLVAGAAPFVITTGSIRDNEAMINGGGGYVALTSRVDMNGGLIQGNIARGTGSVGPNPVFGQPLQGITPGAANYNGHGGGVYVAQNAAFRASAGQIIENNAVTGDGGGIYTENRLYACTVTPAGATGFYSNITIGAAVVLGSNDAYRHTLRTPCNPTALTTINASVPISTSPFPGGAWPSFPNGNHPLNNFDVNYLVTYDVPPPLDPEITKVAINPSTGTPLTAEERVLLPGSTVTYRITVTNPNRFVLEDHLVIDNLANGRLTNAQINPIGIVPSSALVTRSGESPVIVENDITELDELHVILDLPAATATDDGVVTITFTASLASGVSGDITNWVYLFGEEDDDGDRGQVIVPDEEHDDGYYREGYIDNDDETVTGIAPLDPEITKVAINPMTGATLTAEERVLLPVSTVTYRITVTNPNRFVLEDHLVVDNLANGRLTNAQINPIGIVPSSALVTRSGESPVIVENELTDFDELHVILNLPAATATDDGVVTITFTASLAPGVSGDITNWVYLFGEEDRDGDRGQVIVPDDTHEDGFYREGYIDNDDETVTGIAPLDPEITKVAINPSTGVTLTAAERVLFPGSTVTYRITVTNPNRFVLEDHLVIDNLANGRLINTEINLIDIVPSNALVTRTGESPAIVENELTNFDELHVILNLPAATVSDDGVVIITFTASLAPGVSGDITNWVYLFGEEDSDGDRGQVIVPDETHDDGYYREGYIDNDDETVTAIDPVAPDIIKEVINPITGDVLPIQERVFAPEATITYRITVTNTNKFIYEDHLVVDNLANGRLINAQIEPSGIVPESALVLRSGASPAVVENDITGFDEVHVILDLPAATESDDGVVTITFTADVAPNVTGSLVNWVYIFGPEDHEGNRRQIIVPDETHEDGYYREGYISNDDEVVTVRVPALVPEISKSADYTEPVHVGDDVDYTIIVENPNDFALVGEFEVIDGLVEYVELMDQTSIIVTQTIDEDTVTLVRDVDYKLIFNAATGVLSVTFSGLPANSVTEITFTVEVMEMPEGGYVPNIAVLHLPDDESLNNFPPGTGSEIPSNEVEVPVVEPDSGVELRFVKANEYLYNDMESDEFEHLDGARFVLSRRVNGEWEYIETVESQAGANLGLVVFEHLLTVDGTYRLDETRPPDGFRLPQGHWIITYAGDGSFDIEAQGTLSMMPAFREVVHDEGVDLYLGNFRETILPASGGLGAMGLTSIGILTISFVVLLYVRGKIVEEEKLKHEANLSD